MIMPPNHRRVRLFMPKAGALFLVPYIIGLYCPYPAAPLMKADRTQKHADHRVESTPNPDMRDQLLDTAFRLNYDAGPTTLFSLNIRFLPSFHPESQIAIRCDQKNGASVTHMVATNQLNTVIRKYYFNRSRPDATEVARHMDIRQTSIQISDETLRRWIHEFSMAIESSAAFIETTAFAGEIQLDGTRYVLKYEEGVNHLVFDYLGPEIGQEVAEGPHNLPLIKWMVKVRKEIAAMTKGEK